MFELIAPVLTTLYGVQSSAARRIRERLHHGGHDSGVSTLEMVIIALGLMAVAGLLVAAITVAVTSRTNQIK